MCRPMSKIIDRHLGKNGVAPLIVVTTQVLRVGAEVPTNSLDALKFARAEFRHHRCPSIEAIVTFGLATSVEVRIDPLAGLESRRKVARPWLEGNYGSLPAFRCELDELVNNGLGDGKRPRRV